VNIKPGMPLFFGMFNEKPVFGLPGNPVSTFVTFVEFVKPAIKKMSGFRSERYAFGISDFRLMISAELQNEFIKKDGKRHFVRGIFKRSDDRFTVRITGIQSSNVLTSLSKANCLIHLPEGKEVFRAGDIVDIELL
jgi:molybdopterin molybdotransferase